MTDTKQTETRRQVAERLVLEHAPRYAGESRLVDAIEAALKDRDDEIERLRKHVKDLNHDLEATIKESEEVYRRMMHDNA